MVSFTMKLSAEHRSKIQTLADSNEISAAWVARKCIEEGLRQIESGKAQLPLPFQE